MGSLHDRLEAIEHVVALLVGDLEYLKPLLGERSTAVEHSSTEDANRRSYVRAVFALVEALVEQHSRLLLDLEKHGSVALDPGVRTALSDTAYDVGDSGHVRSRSMRLSLDRRLRLAYRTAGDAFGEPLDVRFDDRGWQSFRDAQKVRHCLTHPKAPNDCYVEEEDLDVVDQAEDWYRRTHNEFTRAARKHREEHGWQAGLRTSTST